MDDGAGGKCARRVHLEVQARNGDIEAEFELNHGPALPPEVSHVWEWWVALGRTRGSSGFGLLPITRHDIHAYERDEALTIQPWERDAILRLDAAYRISLVPDAKEAK